MNQQEEGEEPKVASELEYNAMSYADATTEDANAKEETKPNINSFGSDNAVEEHNGQSGGDDNEEDDNDNDNNDKGNASTGDNNKKMASRMCHDEAFWYHICERYQQYQERHPSKNISQRYFLKSKEVPELSGEAKDCRSFSRYWKRYVEGDLSPESTAKRRRKKLIGGKRTGAFRSSFSAKLLKMEASSEEVVRAPPKLLPLGMRAQQTTLVSPNNGAIQLGSQQQQQQQQQPKSEPNDNTTVF